MALPGTQSLLLLLVLALLGLGLVQPSYGQDRMYQRFLRQHVDSQQTGGSDSYCNLMMQRRRMTSHQCKRFNTFIHEDIWNIRSICSTASIQCKNGQMNCHEGVLKVTDCRETGSSRAPNCRYRASASTRRVVIACEGNPEVPVPDESVNSHVLGVTTHLVRGKCSSEPSRQRLFHLSPKIIGKHRYLRYDS
ncbi:Ribonuclease 4 [Microtus ochrogaster]|uniref:Ribonuclease 4 n=1 Tax=Microtus ochrogaster TaxID=79684 RepID=A0A8J6G7M6_MICOH|nr:Ribonuclease 4 [Microtus ochrogaster]